MSTTASVNFRTEFEALVKQVYQMGSRLDGTTRVRENANAKTVRFPKLGKGIATPRIPQAEVTLMNLEHSYVDVTLTDWDASELAAIEDLDKLAFDERTEIMKAVLMAIGRRRDQFIIDAMALSANTTQVGEDVGATDSSLNIDKILRAKRLMDDAGVPENDRYMAVTARAIEAGLALTQIGSADYNSVRALAMGQLNTFAGFKFIMIESRSGEGGLPLVAAEPNKRNCFAWHKDAVGLALTGGIRPSTDWIPMRKSWLVTAGITGGGVTIDTDGVYDVLLYEA